MKKLLASIIVLIITTAISFTQSEIVSNDAVETSEIKKEIISNHTIAAASHKMK